MPGLFGGGYRRGGGFGCGCLFLILILGILFCSSGAFVGPRYYGGPYYNPGYNDFNNNSGSMSGQNPSLANESPAIQTQTARDLAELHAAFDQRIAEWQNQLGANENRSIPPQDAGLTNDNNTQAVLYGKCGTAFYLYVVLSTRPDNVPADGEGYVYTTANSPGSCHPPQWTVYASEDVGGNWYFVQLQSRK